MLPGNKFLSKNALEILEVLHQEENGKLCVPNQKGPSKTRRQPFSGLLPRKFIICLGVFVFKIPQSFLGGSFLLGVGLSFLVVIFQHLQRGAKWFLKSINSPFFRV